ncbi:MAG TPA: DUF6457 domain-containing protein [Marmoricola sp.]|nr:DUF6457 domain-containing protein [Marmoricola sp.]
MTEDNTLDGWLHELCDALSIPRDLAQHRNMLLDVARDAAHNVARPAAPLTTFLVGYAAGKAGSTSAVTQAAQIATDHALERGN